MAYTKDEFEKDRVQMSTNTIFNIAILIFMFLQILYSLQNNIEESKFATIVHIVIWICMIFVLILLGIRMHEVSSDYNDWLKRWEKIFKIKKSKTSFKVIYDFISIILFLIIIILLTFTFSQ